MQRVRSWWTPERVESYLRRYRAVRARLKSYGGEGPDCPDPERPPLSQGARRRYEQAFASAVGIVVDLDRAIDALPKRWRRIAHLYWRVGLSQERIGGKINKSQQAVSREITDILEVITAFLCGYGGKNA